MRNRSVVAIGAKEDVTGQVDRLDLNADSGKLLLRYSLNLRPQGSVIGCPRQVQALSVLRTNTVAVGIENPAVILENLTRLVHVKLFVMNRRVRPGRAVPIRIGNLVMIVRSAAIFEQVSNNTVTVESVSDCLAHRQVLNSVMSAVREEVEEETLIVTAVDGDNIDSLLLKRQGV